MKPKAKANTKPTARTARPARTAKKKAGRSARPTAAEAANIAAAAAHAERRELEAETTLQAAGRPPEPPPLSPAAAREQIERDIERVREQAVHQNGYAEKLQKIVVVISGLEQSRLGYVLDIPELRLRLRGEGR